jgi:hypothetical protein
MAPTRSAGPHVPRDKTRRGADARRARRIVASRPAKPAAQQVKEDGVAASTTGAAPAAVPGTTAYQEEDEFDAAAYREDCEFDNGPDLDESVDGTESGHEFWSPTIPSF